MVTPWACRAMVRFPPPNVVLKRYILAAIRHRKDRYEYETSPAIDQTRVYLMQYYCR